MSFSLLSPVDLANLISKENDGIIALFIKKVKTEVPGAHGESFSYIEDHLPDVLQEMSEFLRSEGNLKDYGQSVRLAAVHGRQRAQGDQYTIHDLRQEYSILRRIIFDYIPSAATMTMQTASLFSEIFTMNLSHSTEVFIKNSANEFLNQRTEKASFSHSLTVAEGDRDRADNERRWFEEAMNRLPKPLFLLDRESRTVAFSNKAAEQMLGFDYSSSDRSKIYGNAFNVRNSSGKTLSIDELPTARVFNGEIISGEEFIVEGKVGIFNIRIFSELIPEVFGQPAAALILFQDITTLKKIETNLRQIESDLNQAIAIAQVGFWYVELPSEDVYVTPLLLKQFGIKAPEGEKISLEQAVSTIHPEDKARVTESISVSMSTNIPYHIEYRVIRDGETRWIEAKGATIFGNDGEPIRFTGTSLDITDRIISRIKLQESADQFRTLADSMPQIVWGAKNNGELDYFNQVWFDYSGTTYEENVGNGWVKAVHPDDLAETSERWANSIAKKIPYQNEFRLKDRDGNYRWHMARAIPVFDVKGEVLNWYGTNTDIDDQIRLSQELKKAKSAAEKANSAKSQFLANMSHEIRTPLGAILGFSGLLRDESIPRLEHDGFVSIVERNSKQLLRIIDDILDLSKVEAGMMLIEQIQFSLPEMITDLASLMGLRAREKGIAFNIKAINSLPKIITTDPTRLRQILINIIGNAIKFTDRGYVEMSVSYENKLLKFEVKDTGRGISHEQEKNLFQAFVQADASTTREYGGTGLGLVLTRSLSEALGGEFFLKHSELGKGSTFTVTVKAEVPVKSEFITDLGIEPQVERVAPRGDLEGVKVLVVEDSPDNQALVSIYLNRAGATIDIASDGEQGIQKATHGEYDVVLMDVQMPVMDGITAVKQLRADGYKKPVIAFTAHAMKEERERCIAAGFSDFLTKPVQREDLIAIIKKHT